MKFEWIKLIKNRKNFFIMIICFGSIFVSFMNIHYYQLNHKTESFDYLKAINNEIDPPQGTIYEEGKDRYKLLHHVDEEGHFYSEDDKTMYDLLVKIVYLLEDENTARHNQEWQKQLAIQTERLELHQKYLSLGGKGWLNEKNISGKLARNEWLKKYQLPLITIEQNQQGIYFVYHLVDQWMSFWLLLIIALLLFDFLPSEYEKRNVRFIFVEPISKRSFFLRKFIVSLASILGAIVLFLLIGFILGTIFYGTGSLNYPLMFTDVGSDSLITIGQYLLKTAILQCLFLSFAIGSLLFISQWLKRSLEVLGLFLFLFVIPNLVLPLFRFEKSFLYLLPMSYMNVQSLLLSATSFVGQSFWMAVLLLCGWNVALWIVIGRYFRRNLV